MPNPIKPTLKTEIIPLLLILVIASLSFYFYSVFPERVPTHWNIAGEIDGWSSRAVAAFVFPAIILGMYVLFFVIPLVDPKKDRYTQFTKVYHIFKNILIIFMAIMYLIVGLNALGYEMAVETWVPAMVGALFILIGNYMAKIKPNWFMGIRTPWTLSSEEVWNKTHRMGGKVFMLGGVVFILMPWLPLSWKMPMFLLVIFAMVAGTMVYSYLIYAKQKNGKNN